MMIAGILYVGICSHAGMQGGLLKDSDIKRACAGGLFPSLACLG